MQGLRPVPIITAGFIGVGDGYLEAMDAAASPARIEQLKQWSLWAELAVIIGGAATGLLVARPGPMMEDIADTSVYAAGALLAKRGGLALHQQITQPSLLQTYTRGYLPPGGARVPVAGMESQGAIGKQRTRVLV